MTFVASKRPPSPASTTATSTPARASRSKAAAVSASNCVTRSSSSQRAVDLRGGRARRARPPRRTPRASTSRVVDADALGERRRGAATGRCRCAAPWRSQDRGDHPRRRGLAVGADDVDRAEALLRRAERRHQPAHAVQPEAHAEQLEARAGRPRPRAAVIGRPGRSQRLQLARAGARASRARRRRRRRRLGDEALVGELALGPRDLARAAAARCCSRALLRPRRGRSRREARTSTAPPGTATVAAGLAAVGATGPGARGARRAPAVCS